MAGTLLDKVDCFYNHCTSTIILMYFCFLNVHSFWETRNNILGSYVSYQQYKWIWPDTDSAFLRLCSQWNFTVPVPVGPSSSRDPTRAHFRTCDQSLTRTIFVCVYCICWFNQPPWNLSKYILFYDPSPLIACGPTTTSSMFSSSFIRGSITIILALHPLQDYKRHKHSTTTAPAWSVLLISVYASCFLIGM